MMIKRFVLPCLVFICVSSGILGQDKKFEVAARKTDSPPVIDGRLDDAVWAEGTVLTDYIQFEPKKGDPASVKTTARILYDHTHIYFGFLCYDPEPERIVLGTKRDGLEMGVDSVCVTLDTFHDKRTGYYFRTNPLGVQHDGRVSENGKIADLQWDGIWKSAGVFTEEGWSAEIAIPLTTVKFKPGENQIWGLQSSRYLPRNLEKSFWVGPLEDYKKIDAIGALTGLNLPRLHQRWEFIPHVITRIQESRKPKFGGGLDTRYDFSSSLSGHLTVNPDFATVEADQEQVNLTRFELNLPEKRNFFL